MMPWPRALFAAGKAPGFFFCLGQMLALMVTASFVFDFWIFILFFFCVLLLYDFNDFIEFFMVLLASFLCVMSLRNCTTLCSPIFSLLDHATHSFTSIIIFLTINTIPHFIKWNSWYKIFIQICEIESPLPKFLLYIKSLLPNFYYIENHLQVRALGLVLHTKRNIILLTPHKQSLG